nr:hypothetical protein BaRGS_023861 [Batillaria attramentaria]
MLFFLFNTFFIPIFCLVGIFGNILCAIVFYRQGLRDRINLCLFSLAVVDGALVTVILHLHAEDASRAQGGESFIFVSHLVAFPAFFIIVIIITTTITAIKLRTAATWRRQTANVTTTITPTPTTSTAAGQRTSAEMSSKEVALTRMLIATSVLFVVCTLPVLVVQIAIFTHGDFVPWDNPDNLISQSPFKAKRVLKTSTMAVIIILVSTVLLGGMLVIAGPKHTSACIFDPAMNETSLIISVTKFYLDNQEILDIIDVFVYSTAFPAFFIIVIIITTTITAIKLRTAAKWRRQTANVISIPITTTTPTAAGQKTSAEMSSKEVALTRMLIATSVLFVVCTLPVLVVQIAIFTPY